jgi:hypothetical protein
MKPTKRSQRLGTALIAALVCLTIVMALLGNLLVGTLRMNRQMHAERDRRQCELLLSAGLARAANRLEQDVAYAGETVKLPAAAAVGLGEGQVTIEVSRSSEAATKIHIVAEYPLGSDHSVRRSRTVQPKTNPSQE